MLPSDLVKFKEKSQKIIALTAWDSISGSIAEQADVDLVLVGDSLAMVCLGYKSTLPVTLENMVYHTNAVSRGFSKGIEDQPLKQQRIKNRLSNQPLYNLSENKEAGANIPEFLRLRQNKKDIE